MRLFTLGILLLLVSVISQADPQVRLQYAVFDPLEQARALPPGLDRSESGPEGTRYYIMQFGGPIKEEWKSAAKAAGAELLDYIPDFAFVVRATQEVEAALRRLPSVRWIGDFAPAYRLSPRLKETKSGDVVIRVFSEAEAAGVRNRVAQAGGRVISSSGRVIRSAIPSERLPRVAAAYGVAWIEPWFEHKFVNNSARGIMTVNNVWTDLGLYGAGQIAAVADTGLDNGKNDSTLSADFRGRLLKAYALGQGRRNDWSDPNGHGTHTAGSILGNGALSGSNPSSHSYIGSFAGVAPEARLVMQSIMDKSGALRGGLPSDLNDLFNPPYQDGARVHSNSWGAAVGGYYSIDSYNTDLFTWNRKDMVICFAAGNEAVDTNPSDGLVDLDSLNAPGTAKNCITVGASENNTTLGAPGTWGQYWPSDFQSEPIKSDKVSNNANGMAAWSSRGPTDDGRIKPDICAPGTNIISCRSHHSSAGTLWGAYNADYVFSGGTSMSTPLVAGACALIREFYSRQGISNPSSALVKATLINGARDMTPGQYSSPTEIPVRPNNVEGWGRLDLKNSIIPSSPRLMHPIDATSGLSTNNTATYTAYVHSSSTPLKVTLVWTDYPGSTTAGTKLVNDLDLTLTGPTGALYRGNGATDRINNVEGIDISNPAAGTYTVRVRGYNVPNGPQPYALVLSGDATMDQPVQAATIADAKAMPDGSLVTVTAKIVTAGSDEMASRFYIEETDRSSGIRVQYGPGGGATVTEGMVVNVTGKLTTIDGERAIIDPIVTQ